MAKKPKKRVGRPYIDRDVLDTVIRGISRGMSVTRACKAAGTNKETYRLHRMRDPKFFARAMRARALGELELLDSMYLAATTEYPGDWRSAEALLKLMYPRRYAKHIVNHEGRKLPGDGNTVEGELAGEV